MTKRATRRNASFSRLAALKITKRIIKPDVYSERLLLLFLRDQTTKQRERTSINSACARRQPECVWQIVDFYIQFWNDTRNEEEERKNWRSRGEQKLYRDVSHSSRRDAEIARIFDETRAAVVTLMFVEPSTLVECFVCSGASGSEIHFILKFYFKKALTTENP